MSPVEIRELEQKAFQAWPALETRANFGWVQRFAGGYTKRANSINAIEAGAHFTPAVMAELERPYRERGQAADLAADAPGARRSGHRPGRPGLPADRPEPGAAGHTRRAIFARSHGADRHRRRRPNGWRALPASARWRRTIARPWRKCCARSQRRSASPRSKRMASRSPSRWAWSTAIMSGCSTSWSHRPRAAAAWRGG